VKKFNHILWLLVEIFSIWKDMFIQTYRNKARYMMMSTASQRASVSLASPHVSWVTKTLSLTLSLTTFEPRCFVGGKSAGVRCYFRRVFNGAELSSYQSLRLSSPENRLQELHLVCRQV
jgi:hypothetical protein